MTLSARYRLTKSQLITAIQLKSIDLEFEWEVSHGTDENQSSYCTCPATAVDQIAARLERSRGWIMKQALSAWIDQEEERNRLTREASVDVDAGHVIDHHAVQAWADSLNTDSPLPVPRG